MDSASSPRGVYVADFLLNGQEVLTAKDSRNNLIGVIVLSPEVDPDEADAKLCAALDRHEPLVRLQLHRAS